MPVVTRSSTAKMEGTLKEMMDMMMKTLKEGQEDMKKSQEEMKGDINKQLKAGQEEMKGDINKQLKAGQEEMKEDINKQLEDMKEDMKTSQEEIKEDMRLQLDEQGKKIDTQVREIISNMKSEMDSKLENIEKVVEETVEDFKKEVGQGMVDMKKEMGEGIDDMKKEIYSEIDKLKSKCESLQNHGIIMKSEECNQNSARIKPPTYDGKTSWQTYMKQFDAAASVNNWTDGEKATALIVSLRGEALEVLQTLSEDRHKNYEQLVLHLEMRFGDKHLQQVYQAQLKGRVQRSNETLQQYEADIARLVYLAYPTAPSDFIEQLAVQIFIDGIRDCETQQALRLARCKKINEVLAYALEFEAAKHASRGYTRVRQIRSQTPDRRPRWRSDDRVTWKDEIEHLQKEITEKLTTLQDKVHERKQGTTYGRRRSLECWNCGEQGHIRSRCPRLGREEATVQQESSNQENSN